MASFIPCQGSHFDGRLAQREARSTPQISAMGRSNVGEGLRTYYKGKIEELELLIKDKGHNLRRLEAQRNELNASGESF